MRTAGLTCRSVSGHYTAAELMKFVKSGDGFRGATSGVAMSTIPNLLQSNGVIQVVSSVPVPH